MTYRQRLEEELSKWAPFKKALRADDRMAFEKMVDSAFRYVHAGSMYPGRNPFDIFTMSVLLTHEERLELLERELKVSMKVDGRITL